MKQLKFMLAAATAVGITAAAQAGDTQYATSTGFERIDGNVGTGTLDYPEATDSYFFYDGDATTGDNESAVEAAGAPGIARPEGWTKLATAEQTQNKVLKVNTGTNALLRTINPLEVADSKYTMPDAVELTEDLYVDTLVQFTVTPVGDIPVPGASDKLMVYLQESATETDGVTATNLVVKGGKLNLDGSVVPETFVVSNFSVQPGAWYRLTVKAVANLGGFEDYSFAGFYVYVDGTLLAYNKSAFDVDELGVPSAPFDAYYAEDSSLVEPAEFSDQKVVFSLLAGDGSSTSTLLAVGFAGEGTVDDFIVTTNDPNEEDPTSVDFTLALGDGVSAIEWTINGAGKIGADSVSFDSGTTITVSIDSVTYAAGYAGTQDWTAWTYNKAETGSIKITAEKFADVTTDGESTVVAPTEATIAAVNAGSFQVPTVGGDVTAEDVAAAQAELGKALTWATASGKGGKSYDAAIEAIKGMNFADPTETETEQAYLLNCAPTANALKEAKDNFKFEAFNPETFDAENIAKWVQSVGEALNDKGYNGNVTVQGASKLGVWGAPDADSKFFKAVLTK